MSKLRIGTTEEEFLRDDFEELQENRANNAIRWNYSNAILSGSARSNDSVWIFKA